MLWEELPHLVLARVFSYLDVIDRINVGKTCSMWQSAAQFPEVWTHFRYSENEIWEKLFPAGIPCTVEDISLFEKISEEILELVKRNVKFFRHVSVALRGLHSFAVFMEISNQCVSLSHLSVYQLVQQKSCEKLHPLAALLERNKKLKYVRVEDVRQFGDKNSAVPMGLGHGKCLSTLWIVNSFYSNSLSNVMYLINLRQLAMSPLHLNFSLLKHLASHSLRELYIVANSKTREFYNEALSDEHWKEICKCGSHLKVKCFLAVSHEWAQKEIFLKPSMPLTSLVYRKNVWLKYISTISEMMAQHSDTLEEFVDFALTEGPYQQPRNRAFADRVDRHLLHIVRSCPKLTTLITKEMLSSAALIAMAYINRGLSGLVIREDMIEYVNDLPITHEMNDPSCMIKVAYNYTKDTLCGVMSKLLGIDWKPLSVEEYKQYLSHRYSAFT